MHNRRLKTRATIILATYSRLPHTRPLGEVVLTTDGDIVGSARSSG